MINAYLTGDAEIAKKFEDMPERLRQELKIGVGRATLKLQREAVMNLTGRVLNVRTGTLRRSIDQDNPNELKNPVVEEGSRIVGTVSTNVSYGKVHEYGFSGLVTVREHLRRQKRQFTAKGNETAASKRRRAEGGMITVREHKRRVQLPERSFLRSALKSLAAAGVIQDEIDAAVKRAID